MRRRNRKLLPRLSRTLLAGVATCVGVAGLQAAPTVTPGTLATVAAGPGGAVRGLVVGGDKIAGVVLWPAPSVIDGRGLPRGTLGVTARAVLDAALEGEADARPILEYGVGALAVGVELPGGEQSRLAAVLARLASPAAPSPSRLESAVRTLEGKQSTSWSDPLERARIAALNLILAGAPGPWSAFGAPGTLSHIDAAAVRAAVAAVRRRVLEVRVAGPAGLAEDIARSLEGRVGPASDALPAPPAGPGRPPILVAQRQPGQQQPESVALVVGFRIQPDDATTFGSALAVLAESLSEGPGSLPQRLRVALPEPAASTVELTPAPDRGGVLLFGVRTTPGAAGAAWKVIEGAISSLRALPMNEDAIFRARQRLDEQAAFRAADATAALTGLLRMQAWSWPPADRWDRPVSAADVQQAARRTLPEGRQSVVVAGAVPEDLLKVDALRTATRVEWARFDPLAERAAAGRAAPGETDSPAHRAGQLAREVLRALGDLAVGETPPGFRARYVIREDTPVGSAEMNLALEAGQDGTAVDVSTTHWRIRAKSGEDGAEAQLPGAVDAATALPETDRLPALVYREPSLLASAVARLAVPATSVKSPCDGSTCEALRVELGEGSVLLLALDSASRLPKFLRIWRLGRDHRRPADEEVVYREWKVIDGVKLAAEFTIKDIFGGERTVSLVDWTWKR